jgi:3-phenylpropionate/trans-cinnamate dioxygenase ferredoxin subunit
MAEFRKVAVAEDVTPGSAMLVEVEGKKIALFNLGGTFYAIDDECPHEGGPLSEGDIEGESVVCPWHASVFNIKTGEVEAPPAVTGVAAYEVRLQGSDVEIKL